MSDLTTALRLAERVAHGAPANPEVVLADLVLLTRFMAERGTYTASDIAYAVEKPWKHGDEIELARSIQLHEQHHPNHTCRPGDTDANDDQQWYCDAGAQDCDWTSSIPV